MARNRSYERQDVVRRAAALFWEKGYKASSISDLVAATRLNTASMYKEFGDKDGLFEEALDYYRSEVMGPRFKMLTDSPNLSGVKAFLDSTAKGAAREEYSGCLMMNHLAQRHVISQEARQRIGSFCEAMEGLLEAALRNAQRDGDLSSEKDPAALASYLMCCVHGLVLYGRHPNKKRLIPIVHKTILHALGV